MIFRTVQDAHDKSDDKSKFHQDVPPFFLSRLDKHMLPRGDGQYQNKSVTRYATRTRHWQSTAAPPIPCAGRGERLGGDSQRRVSKRRSAVAGQFTES
jgi:hypothetical protein